MVQKVKDRITNALIMFASGCGVALFMFFVNNSYADAKEVKSQLDKKVNTEAFNTYKTEHKQIHVEEEDRIIKHFDSRFEDFKDFMIELNKN